MQTYLKNGYIVSMDQQDTVFDGGGVLVEDDRITAVGKVDPRLVKPDAEVIDLQGKYVLPGFVNTHVHTSQQISRGVGDDVDFICWLHDRMWPFESSMTEEDSYVSTLMTSLELIRSGVTSFAEPGGQFVSGMARGTAESGLRGKLAKSVMDCGEGLPEIWQRTMEQELEQQVADLEKFHNTADGRVQVWFGLRTIFNNTDELCVRTQELEADSVSGNVDLTLDILPTELDIETSSGPVTLAIPTGKTTSVLSVELRTTSGQFSSDVPVTHTKDAPWEFQTVSGDVTITTAK